MGTKLKPHEHTTLCTYSKSEVYSGLILESCPLGLNRTEGKKCPCRKRLYHFGPHDLRVLSCTFPETYKGEPIRDADAFSRMLKQDRKVSKTESKTEETVMTTAAAATTEASPTTKQTGSNGKTAVPAVTSVSLDIYRKMADPLKAIESLGRMFYESKMFGCNTKGQGGVLAMACLTEGRSPIEILRKNHIIGGNLTMKADAMLADFKAGGGKYKVLARSNEEAGIQLDYDGNKLKFKFTWEEAKGESYVYMKDGKTLKDNWSTPRRRMQMLWARLVSDSVRVVMPEVVAGTYTPEEFDAPSEPHGDEGAIDAEYEVVDDGATASTDAPTEAAEQPTDEPTPQPEEAATAAPDESDRPQPVSEADAQQPEMITQEQAQQMLEAKKQLGISDELWKKVLSQYGITRARDLSFRDADDILYRLADKLKAKVGTDELSQWAQGALAKNG